VGGYGIWREKQNKGKRSEMREQPPSAESFFPQNFAYLFTLFPSPSHGKKLSHLNSLLFSTENPHKLHLLQKYDVVVTLD